MEANLDLPTIFGDLRAAVARVEKQLPYVLATGTSENYLRDTLAYQLHTKHRDVAREYSIGKKNKRTVDIAVLGPSGRRPKLILELKQLYLHNLRSRQEGHLYIRNIVEDVVSSRLAFEEEFGGIVDVYGIIVVRRILPEMRPLFANDCSRVSPEKDMRAGLRGLDIELMHQVVNSLLWKTGNQYPPNGRKANQILPQDKLQTAVACDCFPRTWEVARILPQEGPRTGLELYTWVFRAAHPAGSTATASISNRPPGLASAGTPTVVLAGSADGAR